MEFSITDTEVYGIDKSIVSSGNSFRTSLRLPDDLGEKDLLRAEKLGQVPAGSGHDSYLNGITVLMNVTAPLYWWKQAQRYHWLDFVSSQSTMHCVTKFNLEERCVNNTNKEIIAIVKEMIDKYNQETEILKTISNDDMRYRHKLLWNEIIASLPCGFCLGATMVTNYRQIKTMCLQRKNHPLDEWKTFIEWAVSLPRFSELTGITAD